MVPGFIPSAVGVAGGSSKADSSAGSVELNVEQDVSDIDVESDYSLFKKSGTKKKKPPKVASVDFDQLFARGHAIGEQRERQTQQLTGPPIAGSNPAAQAPNGHTPTPFEIYSKEEAFKQAQQGAGISYEEKVQSYLNDQQHQLGLNGQPQQMFNQFSAEQVPFDSHESRRADRKLKRERSRSDSNKRTKDQSLERKKEPPKVIGYAKPEDIHIDPPDGQVIQASPPSTLQRPGSRMSNSGRPIDQEEFLQNMQEFIRKAEVDQEYSQPVWPAIIQSPNELPPTKAQAKAQSLTNLSPTYGNTLTAPGNASPRPASPYDPQTSFNYSFSTAPVQRSPQPGYEGQRQGHSPRPSLTSRTTATSMQGSLGANANQANTAEPQRKMSYGQRTASLQATFAPESQRKISNDLRAASLVGSFGPSVDTQIKLSGEMRSTSQQFPSYGNEVSNNEMQRRVSAQQRPVSPYQQQQQRPVSPYDRSMDESRTRMAPSPGTKHKTFCCTN